MSLFPNRNRPRTCLDLNVGSSHVVEVVLHLPRAQWEWYQSNEGDIVKDILTTMERSVIPRSFGKEIEEYHRKHNPALFPPSDNVGSKNSTSKGKGNTRKRKRQKAAEIMKQYTESEEKEVDKDVNFAFGELVQLAYRKLKASKWSQAGRTLFLDSDGDRFQSRPKLPCTLEMWCSQLDPDNKTNPDPENVGFYRPEMIPLSSIFREPKQDEETE